MSATPRPARRALDGARGAVVHLAAIVGDPACAPTPSRRRRSTWRAARALVADAREAGVEADRVRLHLLELRPHGRPDGPDRRERRRSRRCRSTPSRRSAVERATAGRRLRPSKPTCLRFATVYGAAPRMRFDLTVNEFTRDLWAEPRRSRCSASSSGARTCTCATPRAAFALSLEAPIERRGRRGLQRRPLRRELPQARPRGAHHGQARPRRRDLRAPRRGSARLQGQLREGPAAARLHAADGRSRRHSRDHRRPGAERFGDPFDGAWSNLGRTIP